MESSIKSVLITGASSGIGLETTRLLAQKGYQVFASVRASSDSKELDNLVEVFKSRVTKITMDISDDASVLRALQPICSKNRIDVLINNAATAITGGCETLTMKEHQEIFNTNYFGAVRVMQEILPQMREQKSGCVINVSSVAGINPFPAIEAYSASKFALEGLTESMAVTYQQFGVSFSLLEVGSAKTPAAIKQGEGSREIEGLPAIYGKAGTEACRENLARGQDPAEIAAEIEAIIRSDKPHLRYQTGDFSKYSAGQRYQDPTGDKSVEGTRQFLDGQGLLTPEQKSVDAPSTWQQRYADFVELQGKRGKHPKDETHEYNQQQVDTVVSIFKEAGAQGGRQVAIKPVLPKGTRDRQTATPLHSICFLGDANALEQIAPSLTTDDLYIEGPFGASFLHMLVAGLENGVPNSSAAACAQILLKKAPFLGEKVNALGSTPADYARYVLAHHPIHKQELKKLLNVLEG